MNKQINIMWICCTIILIIFFVIARYKQYKLVIKQGLPNDPEFYKGWTDEPLTNKWLHVTPHIITSLFKQDLSKSFYGIINNVNVGMAGTSQFDAYFQNLFDSAQKILSNKYAKDDDVKYVKIIVEAGNIINSYVKKHKLEKFTKYMNCGLMVSKTYRQKGIGTALMRYKLKQLNSYVFAITTNKYSAKVMEKCQFKLIKLLKYYDYDIISDDIFSIYVWCPN